MPFPLLDVIRLLALIILSLIVSPAHAQFGVPITEDARASVLTMLPGDGLHALFGHTAIRISDPQTGLDRVYNYGTFDFGDPLFVPRFIHGQMDYFLSVPDFHRTVDHYQRVEGRPVLEQQLNLFASEVATLFTFLERNAQPEHRYYRYDFFFDNCSTRPRDVLEHVLGERLEYGLAGAERGPTFRQLLAPYLVHRPALRDGMFVLLGTPADRRATPRETMFLPIELFDVLEGATVLRDTPEPLVVRTDTLSWVAGYEWPRRSIPWLLVFTSLLLVAGIWWTMREFKSGAYQSAIPDVILFGLTGLIGVIMLYMGYISHHEVTGPNLNLFWAWPTHLVAAVMLRHRITQIYLILTGLITAVFVAAWFMWPQVLPVAFLPLATLLALRAGARWYLGRRLVREA
jgi:hypothetical protein